MSEYQVKIATDDAEWWERLQRARAEGKVTSMSGLGKQALAHAMENGQPATEALLRSNGNGNPSLDASRSC
jgi:hypothetical protein